MVPSHTARLRVTGPALPAVVWERYADPAAWPTWSPQIRSVTYAGDRLRQGGAGVVHGPVGVRVRFAVTAWNEALRTWSWLATWGPVRLELTHGVEPAGDGTAATLTVTGPAPVVLAYLPVARLALGRLTET